MMAVKLVSLMAWRSLASMLFEEWELRLDPELDSWSKW